MGCAKRWEVDIITCVDHLYSVGFFGPITAGFLDTDSNTESCTQSNTTAIVTPVSLIDHKWMFIKIETSQQQQRSIEIVGSEIKCVFLVKFQNSLKYLSSSCFCELYFLSNILDSVKNHIG